MNDEHGDRFLGLVVIRKTWLQNINIVNQQTFIKQKNINSMSTYVKTEGDEAPALLFENVAYSVDKRSLFSLPPCINKRKQIIQNCSGIVRVSINNHFY